MKGKQIAALMICGGLVASSLSGCSNAGGQKVSGNMESGVSQERKELKT